MSKYRLNPNWHEGGHFPPPVLFGSELFSWIFIKNFQTCLEVKIDIKLIESYKKMPLSGSKDEHFSYFHRSCQLGLNWDHLSSFLSTSVWARTPAYFKVHSRAFHRIKSKYEEQNWNIQNNFKSKWISRINFIIRGIFSFLFQVHKHTIPSYAGATEGTYIVSALICTIFTLVQILKLPCNGSRDLKMLQVHNFTIFFLHVLNFSLLKSLLLIIEIPTNWLFQITYKFQKLCNFVKVMKLSCPNDYDKTNAKSKGEDNKYKQQPLATIFICSRFPAATGLDRIGHVFFYTLRL